jgi:hypothetical protein
MRNPSKISNKNVGGVFFRKSKCLAVFLLWGHELVTPDSTKRFRRLYRTTPLLHPIPTRCQFRTSFNWRDSRLALKVAEQENMDRISLLNQRFAATCDMGALFTRTISHTHSCVSTHPKTATSVFVVANSFFLFFPVGERQAVLIKRQSRFLSIQSTI